MSLSDSKQQNPDLPIPGPSPIRRLQNGEWWLFTSGFLTAIATAYLYLGKYHLLSKLDSNHNSRLLNSVKAWADHGYWKLSGFLYFQENYDGSLPDVLYRSHAPFYVLPHYFAYRQGGEPGFWLVVGLIPVITAVVMSSCLAAFGWMTVKTLSATQRWAGVRGAASVVAIAAFSMAFTSEPIWSLSWNSFDGSAACMIFVIAVTTAVVFNSQSFAKYSWISALLLILSSLLCARLGLAIFIALVFIRLTELHPKRLQTAILNKLLFSWPVIISVLLASLSHFLHLAIAEQWQGLRFKGSDLLPRMGMSSWWEHAGQGRLHYKTPLDAFTFIWRQSEIVIDKLPLWISMHHGMVWIISLVSAACIVGGKKFFMARPFMLLLTLPALIWTVVLNQSAAEHPDLVSILWLPAYVLGAAILFGRFFVFLRSRLPSNQSYLYMGLAIWLFFLWQNQYFMRAYPI